MTTSRKESFLSEVLEGKPIPAARMIYFRDRLKSRFYDLVMGEFIEKSQSEGLTKADLARRIGKRPEQINRWLGTPGNWTLDTVSDLMLAISAAEPEISALPLRDRKPRNYGAPEWLNPNERDAPHETENTAELKAA